MKRKRPIGITLLAVLSALAALAAFFYVLQLLGILPIRFGDVKFFTPQTSWIGAILWALLGFIYLWVARMLWIMDPRGWGFTVVLSTLNLILAVLSIIGRSTWQTMLATVIINGLILLYCVLPSTKEAFFVKQ